jgi:alginate O-acetyltransferase complex protein AlgI
MPFNSSLFVFVFAPLVVLLGACLPVRLANKFLLLSSIIFYAWGEPKFVFVILFSALVDFMIARALHRARSEKGARWLLALGVLLNLALLVYCKYFGWFLENLKAVLDVLGMPFASILLPLGISFVVFEKISFLVDVYRRTTPPARTFSDYLFFVFFFPKMLAGPIIKYHEIRFQIENRKVVVEDVELGILRFLVGLAKKVLIADTMAEIVDKVYSANPSDLGNANVWFGALCFAIQIYFDFSGYSDMAIGLARTFGFRLRENFNQPYRSVGFTDFWQRWHISLSTWIRDYLYIPLGGSRTSTARMYVNLWICFLASGVWHGANWTFVVWGAYHGIFVSADHLILRRVWPKLPRWIGIVVTFFLVTVGWVIFRATTISQATSMLRLLFDPASTSGINLQLDDHAYFFMAVGLLISFVPLPLIRDKWRYVLQGVGLLVPELAVLAISIWSFGRLFASTFHPFIYFRF